MSYLSRLSAAQGHPHASYNLAVGGMKGYTKLSKGWDHYVIVDASSIYMFMICFYALHLRLYFFIAAQIAQVAAPFE